MQEFEILLPPSVDGGEVTNAIDSAIVQAGLCITFRSSLKKYPGSVHWHAKNGREPGTLEITFWPQQHRAWFTVQNGRNADWIDEKLKLSADLIEARLADI